MKLRGDSFGIASSLNAASLNKTADKILSMTAGGRSDKAVSHEDESISAITLRNTDDEATVAAAVHTLGYELSEEDMHKVYENFLRLSEKKSISAKELDVIDNDIYPTWRGDDNDVATAISTATTIRPTMGSLRFLFRELLLI